jgi:hypothetical protein
MMTDLGNRPNVEASDFFLVIKRARRTGYHSREFGWDKMEHGKAKSQVRYPPPRTICHLLACICTMIGTWKGALDMG